MLIPEFLFGLYEEVKDSIHRIAAQLKRGAQWSEVIPAQLMDSATRPGLIVLHGPSPLLASQEHFHVFALVDELSAAKVTPQIQAAVFNECLKTSWGTLSLNAFTNQTWLHPVDRHAPFMKAMIRYWDDYNQEGPRYSFGMNTGVWLWEIPSNIKFVLARLGVPEEALRAPLPEGGVATLLKQYKLVVDE